jgi:DNA-binding MarR family transcriptional regulator
MSQPAPSWTFLSNHAHVLIALSRDASLRMRDIAELVGITERAVQRIVRELVDEGYLEVTKEGRRNHYRINGMGRLRHPLEADVPVGQLLSLLQPPTRSAASS